MPTRVCLGCGDHVENASRCPDCTTAYRAKQRPSTIASRRPAYKAARAAMVKQLAHDGFLVCWLCGEKIRSAVATPDGLGLEADHVVRAADDPDSDLVRPSHRRCNRRRKVVRREHPGKASHRFPWQQDR